MKIGCPNDLNQFILGEPIFENPFPAEECEQRKFYGDCYHCFATAIASRDKQIETMKAKENLESRIDSMILDWLNSFDTSSATKCFEAVNLLKERLEGD